MKPLNVFARSSHGSSVCLAGLGLAWLIVVENAPVQISVKIQTITWLSLETREACTHLGSLLPSKHDCDGYMDLPHLPEHNLWPFQAPTEFIHDIKQVSKTYTWPHSRTCLFTRGLCGVTSAGPELEARNRYLYTVQYKFQVRG